MIYIFMDIKFFHIFPFIIVSYFTFLGRYFSSLSACIKEYPPEVGDESPNVEVAMYFRDIAFGYCS